MRGSCDDTRVCSDRTIAYFLVLTVTGGKEESLRDFMTGERMSRFRSASDDTIGSSNTDAQNQSVIEPVCFLRIHQTIPGTAT